MAYAPDQPFPKTKGHVIKSKDWNDAITEIQRLDNAKVNKSGDAVAGSLTVAGNVGIKNTNPQRPLQIGGETSGIGLAPSDASPNAGYVRWGDNTGWKLHFGRSKESPSGALNTGTAGVLMTLQDNGNLGVGTSIPNHRFHVVAADAIGLFESSGTQAYLRLSTNEGINNRVELTNRPGGRLSLWTAGGGDVLNITKAGNVGIGTTEPGAKLQVTGGAIMPAVGNSAVAGIRFPADPGGGSGDEAFIRYFVESGETTKLLIGNQNDADDRISFYQFGGERLTIYNGNVGVGTTTPTSDKLDVAGSLRILTGSNPIRFTSGWSGFPDAASNQAEISNDTGTYKTLMIVGNKSAGAERRVSVWDRLDVNGKLVQNGQFIRYIQTGEVGSGDMNPGATGSEVNRIYNVSFSPAFSAPPSVVVALKMLDVDHNHNTRIDVWAEAVTAQGFKIHFRSWADTHIYGSVASWVAHGVL